jgi:hypothetical protein
MGDFYLSNIKLKFEGKIHQKRNEEIILELTFFIYYDQKIALLLFWKNNKFV